MAFKMRGVIPSPAHARSRLGDAVRLRRWVRPRRTLVGLATAGLVLATVACHPTNTSALRRPSDPVVLTGADLPPIPGVAPTDVLAFIRHDGTWYQIPVQVDEMHMANMGVVHDRGVVPDTDYLVYSDPGTLTGSDPNPAIDRDDEIAFMARDAGPNAPAGTPDPDGVLADSGVEVAVDDPAAGGADGYVYLFRRAPGSTLDQGAGHDYVSYDFVLDAGTYPEDYNFDETGGVVGDPPGRPPRHNNPETSAVATTAYRTTFQDRWINEGLEITAGDASGVDILDRDKNWFVTGPDNPTPKPPKSCIRNENTFAAGHGAFVSNIDGPVRAIRSFIGANSAQYTERRHIFYAARQEVTVFLRGHPGPDAPDAVQDYSDGAIGMTYRNDRNRSGVTIDGQPDSVVPGKLQWEQVSGPQGTYTVVHDSTITSPNVTETSFYADDATPDFVQCTGDAKAIGTSGAALTGPNSNTDPTRVDEFGELFEVTFRRTAYYDAPGGTVATAQQRDTWVRTPLVTTSATWTG